MDAEEVHERPEWNGHDWTVPKGYAHPRCSGCGHNFYDAKPRPMENGMAATIGLCQWCVAEQVEEDDEKD